MGTMASLLNILDMAMEDDAINSPTGGSSLNPDAKSFVPRFGNRASDEPAPSQRYLQRDELPPTPTVSRRVSSEELDMAYYGHRQELYTPSPQAQYWLEGQLALMPMVYMPTVGQHQQ